MSTQFDLFEGGGAAPPEGPAPASPARSRLLDSLAAVCLELPLEEKVLVAPSFAIGHQIAEALVRSGTPWVHLRVDSVRGLAHAIAGPAIAAEGLTLLSRAQALALVEQACAEELRPGSYFGALASRPGLHRAIQRAFHELRSAGISPAALPETAFDDHRKAAELKAVLERYETSLSAGRLVDRAEVLRRAVEILRRENGASGSGTKLYLLAAGAELSPVERELVALASRGNIRELPVDDPGGWRDRARGAKLFRALGEENEVREVFRRILAAGIPFDDVELLATDLTTYGPLVYELSRQYGVPCNFAGGIPTTFAGPAQAAIGYLSWLGRGFESEELRGVLAGGLLDLSRVSGRAEPPGALAAARELREARIGWGRDRNLECLDAHVARLRADIEFRRRRAEDAEEDRSTRVRWLENRVANAVVVRDLVAKLLSISPDAAAGEVELADVARAAEAFVTGFARISSDLDAQAASALRGLFGEFATLPIARLPLPDAVERLTDAVRSLHVGADRPRPGRLHVAEYRSGGFAGRGRTFLVGLDSRRHPGAGLQDPVLLDAERREINDALRPLELPMRGGRPAENVLALQSCLARLRGEITASYPSWSLLEAREQFPAPGFLDLYRAVSGDEGADYSTLDAGLDSPAGFLPDPASALDETEWWLSRSQDPALASGRAAEGVRAAYPWLQDGHFAASERASDRFTVYDGMVRDPAGLDPRTSGKPTSCSRIEELARCPFSYFVKRVLHVQPPEPPRDDPTVWLTPMEKGLLLHEVFRRFYAEAPEEARRPVLERDRERIEAIALEEIARWERDVPPRSVASFEALRDDAMEACRIFLREEEDHCRAVTPRWFEVSFGPSREGPPLPPGSAEPVRISLGSGESFLLSGRIDRVDATAEGGYQVWDYKTGSAWSIDDPGRGRGGRRIQDGLYAQALEVLLARSGIDGRVESSGYFFPGRRGEGNRWSAPLDPAATRTTLRRLFDLVANGAFTHAGRKDDCNLCDFHKICGSPEEAALRADPKNKNLDNPTLQPYRELNP